MQKRCPHQLSPVIDHHLHGRKGSTGSYYGTLILSIIMDNFWQTQQQQTLTWLKNSGTLAVESTLWTKFSPQDGPSSHLGCQKLSIQSTSKGVEVHLIPWDYWKHRSVFPISAVLIFLPELSIDSCWGLILTNAENPLLNPMYWSDDLEYTCAKWYQVNPAHFCRSVFY